MTDPVVGTPAPAGTGTPAPASTGFDPKAIETMVQGAVKSSIENLVKESQARQADIDAQKAVETARAAEQAGRGAAGDAFNEMLRPHIEPTLRAAKDAETRATLAADAVTFYTDPTMATALKYRERIEQVTADQAKKGNVISRKDAWNWLRGGELYDTLQKENEAGYATKLKEAREAETAGASAGVARITKPIEGMTTDELGDALKGLTF